MELISFNNFGVVMNKLLNAFERWMCEYPPLLDDTKDMNERPGGFWTYRAKKAYPPGRGPEKYWDDLEKNA
jgi:hypothetical protein